MTPNKCKEVNCPRHGIDKNGTDVCILYHVSEVKDDLAVIDVFNVGHKQCKRLREELKDAMESRAGKK